MICKTSGIVFKTIKYSDHSLIVKIYTRAFGLRSYMIRGMNNRKSAARKSAFQPLSILELVVYEKEKEGLQSIREVESIYPYKSLPFDIRKSCIAMFMNEVMYRSIFSEEADDALFHFLHQSLISLDDAENSSENFHLRFLARLSRFLGFAPMNNFSPNNHFFDLQEGLFVSEQPMHNNFLDSSLSLKFTHLIADSEQMSGLMINALSRNELLAKLIDYYRLHLPGFGEIKSHLVLKDVLA
ncbi:MAG: DNA repair protein RecO [Bacteroidales bacterium]|nr:DNA repair protein RecO [Bacteroidales bacterium]